MNGKLHEIIKRLDNETVLIVMGDHGMTEDGNHGGASKNETETTLFTYSKKGFHSYPSS